MNNENFQGARKGANQTPVMIIMGSKDKLVFLWKMKNLNSNERRSECVY